MNEKTPRLLVLVGPTGSGKTETAIRLAESLNGEIISADSRYFFKELKIGTAKPGLDERGDIPHHLIDVTDLDHPWSLGEFIIEAKKFVIDINERGRFPILVGGSGQYIRAITENWSVPAQVPDHRLRDQIELIGSQIGFEKLHMMLSWVDPQASRIIDARNHRRTIRALEVMMLSGYRFSDLRQTKEPIYDQLIIGINWSREELYVRIDMRINQMISGGLIEETKSVINAGKTDQLSKTGIIGYTEMLYYLAGKTTLEETIRLIRRNTRRFIRHQANWFKPDDAAINWFNAQDPAMLENMLGLVRNRFQIKPQVSRESPDS